ncbi:MAG: hypothetical protein RIQ92_36, partial [Actinomycetota bacterium]
MASRGHLLRDPHFQVGSRVTSALLVVVLALVAPSAVAASKSPTPKASAAAKATPTAKASATATAKATTTAKATPKATKKPPVKKKKKAKIRVTPSPKPVWPPKGFSVEGEVYAKVPSAKELVSLISANSYLEKQIKECTKYICG